MKNKRTLLTALAVLMAAAMLLTSCASKEAMTNGGRDFYDVTVKDMAPAEDGLYIMQSAPSASGGGFNYSADMKTEAEYVKPVPETTAAATRAPSSPEIDKPTESGME